MTRGRHSTATIMLLGFLALLPLLAPLTGCGASPELRPEQDDAVQAEAGVLVEGLELSFEDPSTGDRVRVSAASGRLNDLPGHGSGELDTVTVHIASSTSSELFASARTARLGDSALIELTEARVRDASGAYSFSAGTLTVSRDGRVNGERVQARLRTTREPER